MTPCQQVPVLVDGDKVLKESYDIALYLEKTYPNAPTLFGGKVGEAGTKLADNFAFTIYGSEAHNNCPVPSGSTFCLTSVRLKEIQPLLSEQRCKAFLHVPMPVMVGFKQGRHILSDRRGIENGSYYYIKCRALW